MSSTVILPVGRIGTAAAAVRIDNDMARATQWRRQGQSIHPCVAAVRIDNDMARATQWRHLKAKRIHPCVVYTTAYTDSTFAYHRYYVKHIELDTRIQCTNDVRACTRELEYNDVRVCTRELDCRHTQTRDRILYNRVTDGQTDGQTDRQTDGRTDR
jgi:hypothetical protein